MKFGPPLLEPGSRLCAVVERPMPRDAAAVPGLDRWNIYGEPQAGAAEEAYFFRLLADSAGLTQTLLRNAAGDRGVSLRFAVEQLPCFTLWKKRRHARMASSPAWNPG